MGGNEGRAINCYGTHLIARNCIFLRNYYNSFGGGFSCWGSGSQPLLENCIVAENVGDIGGGLYFMSSTIDALVRNCVIVNNTGDDGGGISLEYATLRVVNSTIYANRSNNAGGLWMISSNPNVSMENSIVWNNQGEQINSYASISVGYSNVMNGWHGTGNIDLDPMFVMPGYKDFRLKWGSPCIDAGNPDPVYSDPDGTPGDMGAYYYDQSQPFRILVTPHELLIEIGENGGEFDYTMHLNNIDSQIEEVEVWSDITLPDGSTFGPVFGPTTVAIDSGITMSRTRAQTIPQTAPEGLYAFNIYAQAGGITVDDNFPFVKNRIAGDVYIVSWKNKGEESDGGTFVEKSEPPSNFGLNTFPNPFNQRVALDFALPAAAPVKLTVYDIQGREVANLVDGYQTAGNHEITFDAKDLVSGVYFVRLTMNGGQSTVRKMVLMK